MPFLFHAKCEHIKNMSPFLTCFPLLPTAKPYGQGNTRLSHIKRRRLIMPLVALVQKNHSAPATSYSRLVLGTRYGRRRCSSKLRLRTSECLYKNPPHIQSAVKPRYLDEEREKALICRAIAIAMKSIASRRVLGVHKGGKSGL